MCQLLDVTRSAFYSWLNRPKSQHKTTDEELYKKILQVYLQFHQRYGSLRITRHLHNEGVCCNKKRVARLMHEHNLKAKGRRKFKATTNSKHNYPVAPNLLNQNFSVQRPNQVWVADITYIATDEGWLYLAAVLDLYSRKIVGWAMDSTMTRQLVIDAFKQAIGRRKPLTGLIHHSDRGSQYASTEYQKLLKKHHCNSSMSRKGNCYDNACMESFWGTLKRELVYYERYKTREQAKSSIFQYIELFYNRYRLHSKLGYKSPYDFEILSLAA
jgi:putative transposase